MTYKIRLKVLFSAMLFALLFLCIFFAFSPFAEAYAEGNEENPPSAAEEILPENSWVEEPSIVRWTYSSFQKTTNIIYGKPEMGEVKFSILNSNKQQISPALTDFSVNDKGEVSNELLEEELKNLPVAAGGYFLRATVEESEEYGGLLYDFKFEVIQAVNRWLVEPQVLGWRYGEYDENLNFLTAIPAYGKNSVKFFLYVLEDNNFVPKLFKDDEGNSVALFGYNKDGKLPGYILQQLGEMESGIYSLVAFVNSTANYTGLIPQLVSGNGGFIFEVKPTENRWLTSPSLVPWSWSLFDSTVNVLHAVPAYPLNAEKKIVKFGIYSTPECDSSGYIEGLNEFYSVSGTADGEAVPSSIADRLRALDSGTYYLLAEVDGNENYSPLKTVSPFTISPYKNYWELTPTIVEWQWSRYDPAINTISALPAFTPDGATVKYKILLLKDYTPAFEQPKDGFIIDGGIEQKLSELPAGDYYLSAQVAGSVNFLMLAGGMEFRVRQFENNWLKTPYFSGFEYCGFDREKNIISAIPAMGEISISVYDSEGKKIIFGDKNEECFKLTEERLVPEYVAAKLNNLRAGEYYLLAYVDEENSNYSTLNCYADFEDIKENSVKFSVSKAPNSWVVLPRVSSWTKGKLDGEKLSITAEARFSNNRLYIYIIDSKGELLISQPGMTSFDIDLLNRLPAGEYTVRFEVAETSNHYRLSEELKLTVFEASMNLTVFIVILVLFIALVLAGVAVGVWLIFKKYSLKKKRTKLAAVMKAKKPAQTKETTKPAEVKEEEKTVPDKKAEKSAEDKKEDKSAESKKASKSSNSKKKGK